MTIQEAIKKAVEGGYEKAAMNELQNRPALYDLNERLHQHLLDPLFWQAAGKSLGWYAGEHTQKAQDMIYHIFADGGSIESYFETLGDK